METLLKCNTSFKGWKCWGFLVSSVPETEGGENNSKNAPAPTNPENTKQKRRRSRVSLLASALARWGKMQVRMEKRRQSKRGSVHYSVRLVSSTKKFTPYSVETAAGEQISFCSNTVSGSWINLRLDTDALAASLKLESANRFHPGRGVGPATFIHKKKKRDRNVQPEFFFWIPQLATGVRRSRSRAELTSPLVEAVRRKRSQVRRRSYAQQRRGQEAVEQADPGSVQAQVGRYSHSHVEQQEHGREQQERCPRAQERLRGPTEGAGCARRSGRLLQKSSAVAHMDGRAAQGQGQHGNRQHLGRVEDPALAYLAVRHVLQKGGEVRQEEDEEDGGEPQDGGGERVERRSGRGSGGTRPVSDCADVVQSSQTQDGPLEGAVELSEDLNQQTYMKPGEPQSQDGQGASGKVQGADAEGHGGVHDGQRNAENPQEALGDGGPPPEEQQIPVQPTLDAQAEQDGEDEQLHGVRARVTPGPLRPLAERPAKPTELEKQTNTRETRSVKHVRSGRSSVCFLSWFGPQQTLILIFSFVLVRRAWSGQPEPGGAFGAGMRK